MAIPSATPVVGTDLQVCPQGLSARQWTNLKVCPYFRQKKGEALVSGLLLKKLSYCEMLTPNYGSPVW
ncbi:MAG: hypothetical protein A2Z47_11720 [Thermodesulfovibrio sp. RBG_19FT_COMBO_42_12]|nr:MAG: hypothetical protein A2Z47_11720 [Thermodesulfovibrio sp. RBG_19FT_COMBO_42_12]